MHRPPLRGRRWRFTSRADSGRLGVLHLAHVYPTRMVTPDPLILTVAPNGACKTHGHHPAVPLISAALAETAKASLEAGAAMIHMHVRRPDGRHLLAATAYR